MAFSVMSFAVARLEAEKRQLDVQAANRIGLIGALAGNPLMALVVGRLMAEREQPSTDADAPTTAARPGIDLAALAREASEKRRQEEVLRDLATYQQSPQPPGASAAFEQKDVAAGTDVEQAEPNATSTRHKVRQ